MSGNTGVAIDSKSGRPGGAVPTAPSRVKKSGLWHEIKKHRMSYAFLTPYMILFVLFIVVPVFVAMFLSLTYFNALEAPKWVGMNNYKLLFLEDDVFLIAVKNTLLFAVVTGPIGYIMSFTLAWMINQLKLKLPYALAFYAPSIVAGIAMAVVWQYLFSGDRYGILNSVLMRWGILDEPYMFLANVKTILPCIILVSMWMSMGNGFLVHLAGLQNVDPQLYEAGKIDGIRTRFQEVWNITLPMMKPQLLFNAVMAVVGGFAVSGVASSLAGNPSPQYAGHTILLHLQDYAFIRFELGYSSAIAVVLFAATYGLNKVLFRLLSTHGDY